MPETLAQKVKAKYPGVYDDLPDTDLEAKVLAKFPGVYDDVPRTQSGPNAAPFNPPRMVDRTWGDTAIDLAKGVGAGAANTVFGGGDIIRRGLGMERIIDTPEVKRLTTPPESTPGKIGYHGEQIAEFFAPTGLIGKAGKVAEVIKSGALSLAQSGSPVGAGVSAALTAAIPGASAGKRAANSLQTSAQKEMAQALGATKEWAKAEAAKLAPQMLQRGVGGSRQAMLSLAKESAKRAGSQLDDAYRAAAAAGESVPTPIIQGNIQLAAEALKIADASGAKRVIPGTERVIEKLDELAEFVASMGDEIPVDKAATIKRSWDRIVSKAGLFGPKAMSSATDSADAWAFREAAGSFRSLLNTNPTVAALNQESAFWTGLKNVLKETEKRTQAQRGGITDAIRGTGGAVAGAAMGGPLGAGIGQVVTQQLSRALNSPAWKTRVSAPLKSALADALASGNTTRIASVTSRIVASLPAQFSAPVTP